MNCLYCGTENPADAKDCSNCSADLTSLPTGTPPPESTAPTMMSSSAEVAAMLAAAKADKEADETSSAPEAEPETSAVPTEVAAAIAAAKASEASSEESDEEEMPPDLEPVAMETETPEVEVPPASLDPTMISAPPEEVAAVIAAVKAQRSKEERAEAEPEIAAGPTLVGIPDPLGMVEGEENVTPVFKETPTPFFNEPVQAPPISEPSVSPSADAPAGDNRRMWIIGGIGGCLLFCCLCSLVAVAVSYLPALFQ